MIALKLELLNKWKQHNKCIAVGEKCIDKSKKNEHYNTDLSRIHYEVAKAYWVKEENKEKALTHIFAAIEQDNSNSNAMILLRVIEDKKSDKSKYFRMHIEGKSRGVTKSKEEIMSFFSTYDVVAEDKNEALEYIKRFEPKAVPDSIMIKECEVLKKNINDCKGVYKYSGGIYYFPFEE